MSNLNQLLKQEIIKNVRKEIRTMLTPLRKKIQEQEREIAFLRKQGKQEYSPENKMENSASGEAKIKSIRLNNTRIRKLRTKLGLTQEKFATLLGINKLTICHWESGKHTPRIDQKKRMVEIRDMKKSELAKLLEPLKEKAEDKKAEAVSPSTEAATKVQSVPKKVSKTQKAIRKAHQSTSEENVDKKAPVADAK